MEVLTREVCRACGGSNQLMSEEEAQMLTTEYNEGAIRFKNPTLVSFEHFMYCRECRDGYVQIWRNIQLGDNK